MSQKGIDQLIINKPYEEPKEHWLYIRETQEFKRMDGRRQSGYWRATGKARAGQEDPGKYHEIALVNKIRPRIKKWRDSDYPNVTGITRKLLNHWKNESGISESQKLFWCQLEAVETAIWLTEANPSERQGVDVEGDGSLWERQCFKLATGTGKTVVMAMLIAWQALNKIANPKDPRFSKNILIITPGLTVKDRLQVLLPANEDNFYGTFRLVDSTMRQEMLDAKIIVTSWHTLAPLNENYGPKVVKMLSEGWDARTVTHILGLRAFTSQLLCEQVIGRGLRRISYDVKEDTGLYEPEYVTVFGVPFTFLPAEQKEGPPRIEKPKIKIEPVAERKALAIEWPHVLRIDYNPPSSLFFKGRDNNYCAITSYN